MMCQKGHGNMMMSYKEPSSPPMPRHLFLPPPWLKGNWHWPILSHLPTYLPQNFFRSRIFCGKHSSECFYKMFHRKSPLSFEWLPVVTNFDIFAIKLLLLHVRNSISYQNYAIFYNSKLNACMPGISVHCNVAAAIWLIPMRWLQSN